MSLNKYLKNVALSLYRIVQGESSSTIKKYSVIQNQFGTNIQIFVFKNCTACNISSLEIIAENIQKEFLKDILKNEYIDVDRIILPETDDMQVYSGKNQVYIGFSKIIYVNNVERAIELLKKCGYIQLVKCTKNY